MPNQNQTALPKFILRKLLNSRTLNSAKETGKGTMRLMVSDVGTQPNILD